MYLTEKAIYCYKEYNQLLDEAARAKKQMEAGH